MSSFRASSQSLKTTHVVVVKLLLLFAVFLCVAQDFRVSGVGSDQWIRLCTLTSNGSSLMNVTMPCGVHVRSNEPKDEYKDNTGVLKSWPEVDDSVEYVKITLDGGRNTTTPEKHPGNLSNRQDSDSTTRQDGDLTTKHSNNKTSEGDAEEEGDVEEGNVEEEGDVEEEGNVEEEGDVEEEKDEGKDEEKEKDAVTYAEDDNDDRNVEIDSGDDDEGQSTYDEDVTILNVEANEGSSEDSGDEISGMKDQLKNRRRGTAVTKVMIGYLMNARNQLYDKIHYLLNLLQQTFFHMKLNCRRRRNSIERRSLFNDNKRIQGNKKNPSFSSMILEPTFERSMMTMSFLMFGVFVIQVVQKLMQTIHQPGENSFIGSSIFGNLPTASSNIF